MSKSIVSQMGMECLDGNLTLEAEFRRLQMRDLRENYLLQLSCGSPSQQTLSSGAFRKYILDTTNIFSVARRQSKYLNPCHAVPASATGGASASIGKTLFAEDKPEENPDWISQRMAFREALDGMGNLQKWLQNKPKLNELEVLITERAKLPSVLTRQNDYVSPNSDIDEVKRLLRMRNASDLSKLLDCNGTGQIKRADLVSMFRKEGLTVSPERLNVLMSALNSKNGNSVTVKNMVGALQAWSRTCVEREQESNYDFEKGIWSGPKMHEDDKDIKASMQDLEVLAIMRRVRAAEKTSSPSALSGPMGREVDHFRGLCYCQYLKTLEKCQRDGLNMSHVTLQKAFLHPSDISSSSMLKGKGSSRHEKAQTLRKKTRKEKNRWAFRWADPNAFWPGKEDNVRLYLPMVERSTAMALFQRIDCTPAPGVGHWPVNLLGYSTSGNIEACKTYIL